MCHCSVWICLPGRGLVPAAEALPVHILCFLFDKLRILTRAVQRMQQWTEKLQKLGQLDSSGRFSTRHYAPFQTGRCYCRVNSENTTEVLVNYLETGPGVVLIWPPDSKITLFHQIHLVLCCLLYS